MQFHTRFFSFRFYRLKKPYQLSSMTHAMRYATTLQLELRSSRIGKLTLNSQEDFDKILERYRSFLRFPPSSRSLAKKNRIFWSHKTRKTPSKRHHPLPCDRLLPMSRCASHTTKFLAILGNGTYPTCEKPPSFLFV